MKVKMKIVTALLVLGAAVVTANAQGANGTNNETSTASVPDKTQAVVAADRTATKHIATAVMSKPSQGSKTKVNQTTNKVPVKLVSDETLSQNAAPTDSEIIEYLSPEPSLDQPDMTPDDGISEGAPPDDPGFGLGDNDDGPPDPPPGQQ